MNTNELVAHAARTTLKLAEATLSDGHFYASLPLCVIDSVFSIGVKYEGTRRTVRRWTKAQKPEWALDRRKSAREHTISEFVEIMEPFTDEYLATHIFENKQRTSTKNGILKAQAVRLFAKALQRAGVERFLDVEAPEKLELAEALVKTIPGQRTGLSFDYFALLAGNQVVKADRMVRRFVADALGTNDISAQIAREAVFGASAILQLDFPHVDTRLLDHEIWRYQSQKSVARKRK